MKKCLLLFFISLILFSCKENETGGNSPGVVTESPYDEPVWHPSGEIIGFNYTPVKEIHYYEDRQYYWKFDLDSTGFWLVNADGTNMRRILPYRLNTPAWSPDGNWIAFSNGAQISIIPFDGEKFNTTAIQILTNKGRNFFPAWSSDGTKIAFTQSVCNDVQCGIWVYSFATGISENIAVYGSYPSWQLATDSLIYRRNKLNGAGEDIGDNIHIYKQNITRLLCYLDAPNLDNRYLQYSPNGEFIAFISILNNGEGVQLFKITSDGSGLTKLTSNGCTQFSWSPGGEKIVYVNFYETYIDETTGSLWTMDADGANKKPLTYNSFKIVQ